MSRARGGRAAFSLGAALGVVLSPSSGRPADGRELVVFAAASLSDVFQKLAGTFEAGHRGTKVRLSFGGSQELRVQIEHGAKVDVFACADEKHMTALFQQDLVRPPRIFARNRPVLIVPVENPAQLAAFPDLAKAERIVVGAADAPIGTYADRIFAAAKQAYGPAFGDRVAAHIRSREPSARQVLAKVALGEADAGIVYGSDAQAARERVRRIAIPDGINVTADYPIAILTAASQPRLAQDWLALVLSPAGQATLAGAGFGPVAAAEMSRSAR